MKIKKLVIKIKKEDLPSMVPRMGVQPTKKHPDRTKYNRKQKHPKKPTTKD